MIRCCIPGCIDEAEAVLLGNSLCEEHSGYAMEHPDLNWSELTTGQMFQWVYDLQKFSEDEIDETKETLSISAIVGKFLGKAEPAS